MSNVALHLLLRWMLAAALGLLHGGCVSAVFYLDAQSRRPLWLDTSAVRKSRDLSIRFVVWEEDADGTGKIVAKVTSNDENRAFKVSGRWRWPDKSTGGPRRAGEVGRFEASFKGITEIYEYSWRSNRLRVLR